MVFSADKNECLKGDSSGCCIAHGNDTLFVHQTWQQILDMQGISSIEGIDLHRRLLEKASSGGGWVNYPWSMGTGVAQTKRALTSMYRLNNDVFYIVAEYLTTPQPPTCDACPNDMECTRDEQSYCTEKPPPSLLQNPTVISLIIIFSISTPLVALFFWNQKRRAEAKSRQKLEELNQQMAEQMEHQMQGMVEVAKDMPLKDATVYLENVKRNGKDSFGTTTQALWYWEEDGAHIHEHKSTMVLLKTAFVRYATEVTEQIEREYQRWIEGRGHQYFRLDLTNKISSTTHGGKVYDGGTGLEYDIDFEAMTQQNSSSNHIRNIRREEVEMQIDTDTELPFLPEGIDFSEGGEILLPVSAGQVIQVSKKHPDNVWLFGTVLFDPLIQNATEQSQDQNTTALHDTLAHALHERPTSGWFAKTFIKPADKNVMEKLLNKLGGSKGLDTLSPPEEWQSEKKKSHIYREGRIEVKRGTMEYDTVSRYFMTKLYAQAPNVMLFKIERIQNLPLWQSYSVKKQTIATRDKNFPQHRENNKNWQDVERCWLFHGTTAEVVTKIERQGFNRAFAGRNAVAYGKGVYFARDASYSSHKMYSAPDKNGIQRMFLCRVVVGDWCKGRNGQLIPDAKRHNPFELFDTTVDYVSNPSVFVVYHDAQAYPEYLISFVNRG